MQTEIVVLKNTKNGIEVDTVYSSNDTLYIETSIVVPSNPIEVNTHPPDKSPLEIASLIAAIVGGIAGIIGAYVAFKQLFKKDRERQKEISELQSQTKQLIKQNELFEKRIRMSVRPLLWSNGSGQRPSDDEFTVSLDNRGHIGFIDSIEFLDGDPVILRSFNNAIPIEKETGHIRISGTSRGLNQNTMQFRFVVNYHDAENYNYKTYFEWSNGGARITETVEVDDD